jgi:polyhydroxyalkanoate synthesis repressor PhaR
MMLIPIKRYQNRKLYNTVTKRYITLVEVGELIRGGMDIVVTDSASGEDITTFILSQVIVGQEKRGERTLSQGLLTGLIRA